MKYDIFDFSVESQRDFETPMVHSERHPELNFECVQVPAQCDTEGMVVNYSSRLRNEFNESVVSLYSDMDRSVMRFTRAVDFIIKKDSITCEVLDPNCDFMIEICLLGHVFGYYLEHSGISPLHGTAIEIDGNAAIFIGNRAGGKSTMAASFLQAGFPLLSDDISPIEIMGDSIWCRRAFPQLKLTPEQLEYFFEKDKEFKLVHPSYSKRSVPVDVFGRFARKKLPVAGIYILERQIDGNFPLRIQEMAQGEGFIELLKHSFITHIIETTPLRSVRLTRLAEIARRIPIKKLYYPSGYEHLPNVHEAVRKDLSSIREKLPFTPIRTSNAEARSPK